MYMFVQHNEGSGGGMAKQKLTPNFILLQDNEKVK